MTATQLLSLLALVRCEGAEKERQDVERRRKVLGADGTARPTTNNISKSISAVSRVTASGDGCHKLFCICFIHLQGTFFSL
jgi:hypothetical protein